VQEVTGDELLRPEKAMLLGPCRVIPQEYPQIKCRSIDVVLAQPGSVAEERLVEELFAEVLNPSADVTIAYRGSHRWAQSYDAISLDELDETSELNARLKDGGTYLITGGMGGLGLVFAESISNQVKANLVLVNRTKFPPKEEWDEWLAAHDEDEEVCRKIRKLRELEARGSEVLVLRADVSDRERMREVITEVQRRCGGVDGVVHAAGVAGAGMIQLKTTEAARSVVAPKTEGVCVLDEVLKDTNHEWMVLCSSLSSVMGGFGQVDYCAANAFLDAFAQQTASRSSTYTVSINWDAWQQVGMAANTARPSDLKEMEGNLKSGILPAEGAEAFSRILLRGMHPQVIVSTKDLLERIERNRAAMAAMTSLETSIAVQSAPSHPRPELNNSYVAPATEVEQTIADIWRELLGIEEVGVTDDFIELGGHSLLATQLVSRLRQAFAVEISLRTIFESPTVAALAEVVEFQRVSQAEEEVEKITRLERDTEEQLLAKIEEMSDEEVEALLSGMRAPQPPASSQPTP
jgi:NAD(P)-dependent dehydrogenase (short-subunit alcohol dehydrogenase family)/acyl carrier protein